MLSIVIPTKNEKYLDNTIKDILAKARGEIEVIVVLDGYNPTRLDGVKYIYHETSVGMREAINSGMAEAKGEYIMKIDAHCIVDEGFDLKLIEVHQPNWVQIPRRYKLDGEKWQRKDEYVDYEHFVFPLKYHPPSLHGFKSPERQEARKDVMLDDTMTFQGSCYFMTRAYWEEMKFLKDERYGTLPAQEATYIGNSVWLSGGRVVVNKNTWYAHYHKTKEEGRGYHMSIDKQRQCYAFSYNHWVNDNREGFKKLVEKFNLNWDKLWKQ